MEFNCYPRSGIRQNLRRTRMRTGKENDIRDSNESSLAGCGIIVKKKGECGIKIPLSKSYVYNVIT